MARRYSQRTIKLYLYHNREFLEFSKKKPYEVSNADVRDYLYHLANDREVSTSTLNTAINALKFYYGEILKRRFIYEIKRPKKDKKLPVVLSQEEVSQILSSVNNIKHRAILMLIYTAHAGDNTKFVYIPKMEQKANFVYKELSEMLCLRKTKRMGERKP